MDLPEAGEPIPPNFLRNHSAVLGVAGQVAGIRLPDPVVPGPATSPLSTQREIPLEQPRHRPRRPAAKKLPASASRASSSLPSNQDAATSALQRLEGNPRFIGVLRALLALATKRGGSDSGAPSHTRPLKRRRLSQVPAGAQDWDVPFPTEEQKALVEHGQQQRSAKLMRDLVSLLSDAVSKETPTQSTATPEATIASSSRVPSGSEQQSVPSSVQGWLDTLSSISPVDSSPDPSRDSLQSLLQLRDEPSHEELFSALFGGSSLSPAHQSPQTTFDPYPEMADSLQQPDETASSSAYSHAANAHVPEVAMNELIASAPWPTPDPSEYSGHTGRSNFDEDDAVTESPNAVAEDIAHQDLPDWEDLLKTFFPATPLPDTASPSGSQDSLTTANPSLLHQPAFLPGELNTSSLQLPATTSAGDVQQLENISLSPSSAITTEQLPFTMHPSFMHLPPTPTSPLLPSTATPLSTHDIDFDAIASPSSSVDPTLLHLNPVSQQRPMASGSMLPPTSVVDQSSVLPTSPADATLPIRPSKVEKKSELLARAAAHRARLAGELERVRDAIWGCTVEDSVLHRLRTGK